MLFVIRGDALAECALHQHTSPAAKKRNEHKEDTQFFVLFAFFCG